MKDNEMNNPRKNLTDKDFYTQACEYFYYHAGQRTTMIQYIIAVFGASIALYGSLLKDYPLASLLISAFLLLVSNTLRKAFAKFLIRNLCVCVC